MKDKLERMKILKNMINNEELEQGVPVRDQVSELEKNDLFKKLRDKTLKRVSKIKSNQEDGSYLKEELEDKERYSDIAESGLSMEEKEEAAAKRLLDKRKEMGLQ